MRTLIPFLSFFVASTAAALPLYDGSDSSEPDLACKAKHSERFGHVWEDFSQYIDRSVTVYVSANAAANYNGNPDQPSFRRLTQTEFLQAVQGAMEVWNRESRGPVFVWGGEVDTELTTDTRLDSSCGAFNRYGSPTGGLIARHSVLIDAIDGDVGTGNRVTENASGSPCSNFGYRITNVFLGRENPRTLRADFVHEFGHVLGLGHAFGNDDELDTEPTSPMSVMQYSKAPTRYSESQNVPLANTFRTHQEHLWPYDRDCVDDDLTPGASDAQQEDARMRELRYVWRSFVPFYDSWGAATVGDHTTSKSGIGTGIVEEYNGAESVGLMVLNDPTLSSGRVWSGLGGYLGVGSNASSSFGFHLYDTLDAPAAESTSMTASVFSLPDTRWRYTNTLYSPPLSGPGRDDAAVSTNDPPRWVLSSGLFMGDGYFTDDLESCDTTDCNPNGLFPDPVSSHAALRTAYDPRSGHTLYASVNTRDCAALPSSDPDRCGGIRIYPGAADLSGQGNWDLSGNLLHRPTTLVLSGDGGPVDEPSYTAPAPSTFSRYDGSTHVAVAIACSPYGGHNCRVAWVDHGNLEGHVLSARFQVVGNDIQWQGGGATVVAPTNLFLGDSDGDLTDAIPFSSPIRSQSDLSMAFIDDRFQIAFKSSMDDMEELVAVARTRQYSGIWGDVIVFDENRTVEPPAFIVDAENDEREALLVWTTLD